MLNRKQLKAFRDCPLRASCKGCAARPLCGLPASMARKVAESHLELYEENEKLQKQIAELVDHILTWMEESKC